MLLNFKNLCEEHPAEAKTVLFPIIFVRDSHAQDNVLKWNEELQVETAKAIIKTLPVRQVTTDYGQHS